MRGLTVGGLGGGGKRVFTSNDIDDEGLVIMSRWKDR